MGMNIHNCMYINIRERTLQLDERGRDDPLYQVQNVAWLTASHVKVWPLPFTDLTTVQADRVFDRHIRPG